MQIFLRGVAVLAAYITTCLAQQVVDLGGSGWTLHDNNGSISIPAHIPSQQYIDLHMHGIIGDPLFGLNNTEAYWVERTNWTYASTLPSLRNDFDQDTRTWLVFEGLDTFANIVLCNVEVGNTDNQFLKYMFDITNILTSCRGEPILSVNFGSATAITHAISLGPDGDATLNVVNSCNPSNEFGCKIYARKEQNDFGWDWSPSLAPAGPWRPVYAVRLTRQEPLYVHNALIDIYRSGQMNNLPPDQSQPWILNASLDFLGVLPPRVSLELLLQTAEHHEVLRAPLTGVYSSHGTITGSVTIDPSKVQMWWPNGMGSQTLYNASISIIEDGNRIITQVQRRVGFRTIVLNLGPVTDEQLAAGVAPGANWHFEINGHELYAKGSNLVPPDTFWPQVNETKMRHLFEAVVDAKMNMLRVWSSGAYLSDWIYDIADEMGILMWSEFEFSDAEYPTNSSFLANYESEAYYNIRRVNHHPSLALWAGGNELESIQLAYFFNPDSPTPLMKQYQHIFEELLIKCVYANSKSISYIPSSTYNGYLSLDFDSVRPQLPRYNNRSSPEALYADTDYYNYDATQAFNLSSYPVGRFADEFGFLSMPSLQTWEEAAAPDQLYVESPTVVNHNRHTPFGATNATPEQLSLAGIAEMTAAVPLWYPKPEISNALANFSAWIYSTQVFQADYYQHQIAFYRRGSGMPERQLGSLYWQLEDLWAAPTWSSIEATGRQKMLYYAAKDIFNPVIVYAYYNITTYDLQIWVTSDLWSAVSGSVSYEWCDWSGKPLFVETNTTAVDSTTGKSHNGTRSTNITTAGTILYDVGPINSTLVLRYENLQSALHASGFNASNALLRLSVTGHQSRSQGESYTHTSFFHPSPLSQVPLQNPGLTLTRKANDDTVEFMITATTAVAAWVWLEYSTNAVTGYWSENGFWLARGENKRVSFTVWDDWSGGSWIDTVSVRSIWNNTQT